ncbi:MAG: phosphoribosylamine--glycine ligase [Planctomycetes bacterium]|nr:phosphoribosylamine--glycine ligase [Planctomycetota bacterium]
MKVLVVGGGGREHALVTKIAASPSVSKVYAAPGNAGIAKIAECVPIDATETIRLRNFAAREGVDLTVVGPEAPLAAGIVDEFGKAGLPAFGPGARAAQLEASKVFAKDLMKKHGIPTAPYRVVDSLALAREWAREVDLPAVIKADGLAAGKGVVVARTREEALATVDRIMKDKAFGTAGERLVIEDCLEGEEVSILAFTDGQSLYPLESSQDHKRALDLDRGPNTGGMGAYSPAPVVDDAMMRRIIREMLIPIIHAMHREGRPVKGLLYAGLMLTADGPRVLEFNVRFGDPEAQALLVRLKSDLVEILDATTNGRLDQVSIEWDERPAVCVVLASGGYPDRYDQGFPIQGLSTVEGDPDVFVFHAGTRMKGSQVVTAGGRVLGVTALGANLGLARERAYDAVKKIRFQGMHYRTDIGLKALDR